ncbi:GDSL-type esterase/lipase family protein [Jiella avicenniae]|uniref:GDSL-type esterase/lipase family protein n=1 Tax=Jiella avicenniae TaxID=2907202 RepID=A0A9X1P1S8_9HYPH|nr:GDSL-type esterase/lipase family protein [Jiella avicenniae]MCE7028204.1 GDSL-type esterase/lipase family protein [Jiella avicenniae]
MAEGRIAAGKTGRVLIRPDTEGELQMAEARSELSSPPPALMVSSEAGSAIAAGFPVQPVVATAAGPAPSLLVAAAYGSDGIQRGLTQKSLFGGESGAAPALGDGPLARFHAKLEALKNGTRTEPVTVLHIGDSHVAADSFTRGIRSRLQKAYGDAGRGAVIPPKVFPYAAAAQVSMDRSGPWQAASSLKVKSGPYGVSGVRLSSASKAAKLTLKSDTGPFDWTEVSMITGPKAGGVTISAGGKSETFSAKADAPGSKTVRLEAKADAVTVNPAGDGTTTILNWGTGRDRPGVRYVNFGIVGATVDVTKRWDDRLVTNDVAAIRPDLIVYGYGTNEGFDDNVDLGAYRRTAKHFVEVLKAAAPQADFAFAGAADGLTKRSRRGPGCSGGWYSPVKLAGIRDTIEDLAKAEKAGFWNWSEAMGGRCRIDAWAELGFAAKDRVHLTSKGYDRSAESFVDGLLMPDSAGNTPVASLN